jgi:hypothetical protein
MTAEERGEQNNRMGRIEKDTRPPASPMGRHARRVQRLARHLGSPPGPRGELRGVDHPGHAGHAALHQHGHGLVPRARGPARLRPGPVSWPAPLAEDRAEREELVREEPRQEPVAAGSRIRWTRCRSRRVPALPLLHGPSRWRGLHVTGEW